MTEEEIVLCFASLREALEQLNKKVDLLKLDLDMRHYEDQLKLGLITPEYYNVALDKIRETIKEYGK